MKFNIKKSILSAAVVTLAMGGVTTSCTGDLDVTPINPQTTQVPNDDALFNKLYASFCLTGQEGASGTRDIPSSVMEDEGNTEFTRMQWYLSEFTTDEAAWVWSGNDGGVWDLMANSYTSGNAYSYAFYYRLYFTITLCNSYINDVATNAQRKAEARFLRALCYYYVIDLYANGSYCTSVSSEYAPYYTRKQFYSYVESELKEIESDLAEPGKNTYGRVDQVADWMLLARLYLNAEVYTGTSQYDLAMTYAKKVIDNGYYHLNLDGATNPTTGEKYSAYQMLFLADNNTNGAQYENIFPILNDGMNTKSYGGMNFLIQASYLKDADGTMNQDVPSGLNPSWGKCLQIKGQVSEKFFGSNPVPQCKTAEEIVKAAGDDRALFYTYGYDQYITKQDEAGQGFNCIKFRNVRSDGADPSATDFVDTDFPMMRIAEAYLTYAEASIRKSGPSKDATDTINALRKRANAKELSVATLDDVLDEWGREFWFEGRRRTDLVRFGKFGGQSEYKWDLEGGVVGGTSFQSFRNIFAIPQTDIANNPNLKQNPEY